MAMKVKIIEAEDRCVVVPYGKIDTSTSEDFKAAMYEAMGYSNCIELDLSEALYISSSGLRVIIDVAKKLDEGGSFKITHVNSEIMEVFDMTGIDDIVTVEPEELQGGSNIKALFFDVDGTLLSHKQGIIPQSAIDAIHAAQARGVKAIIATGRDIVELDKLPIHDVDFDAYLTLNGNICLDSDRKMFDGNPIDPGEVEVLVSIFKAGRIPFVLIGQDKRYINYVDDVVINTQLQTHGTIPEVGEYHGETIYQCLAFVDASVRQRLEHMLDHCTITSWNDTGIDIIAKTGGKDAGIQKFLDREGITRSHIMAFGDGENDRPMLEYAAIGVAMGNGVEKLKAIADYITTSVDDDGIANALRHFEIID
ncbi:MAG: Cof-type HAD-IIB family hydrolase [Coriobacteriales bacterium]|nr:Cof-type HAD-IIB family hydrolase [Coriobacteriales bacterium]